jgi:hypothetical protein
MVDILVLGATGMTRVTYVGAFHSELISQDLRDVSSLVTFTNIHSAVNLHHLIAPLIVHSPSPLPGAHLPNSMSWSYHWGLQTTSK